MRSFIRIFSLAAVVALGSCNQVDFKKTQGGMPYKIFPGKDTQQAVTGGYLKVHMTTKLNDSILGTTYTSMPTYLPVQNETQPYDVSEIIPQLKKGDSVYAVQLIDTFMARAAKSPNAQPFPPQFKKGDKIITTIKVLDVYKTEEQAKSDYEKEQATAVQGQIKKDETALQDYFSKNNVQPQKVGQGTYVQILSPGSGEAVADGKYVSLRYKGYTLDGKVFDTNMDTTFGHGDPMNFVVGAQPMIKGFDEGIRQLKEGAKARIFIPSALAYGQNAPPTIGPNANLIFDVEVLDVAEKAPPSNKVPSPNNNDAGR